MNYKIIVLFLLITFFLGYSYVTNDILIYFNHDWLWSQQSLEKKLNLPLTAQKISVNIDDNSFQVLDLTKKESSSPVFYSIYNSNNIKLAANLMINNKDWSSNESIIADVFKNLDNLSLQDPAQKALALWNFMIVNRVHSYPSLDFDHKFLFIRQPVKYFNDWGYGFCSDTAYVLAQLAELSGFQARAVHLQDHFITEIFYNNDWHAFDADREVIYLDEKKDVASVAEIKRNPDVFFKQHGDKFEHWGYDPQRFSYESSHKATYFDKDAFLTDTIDFKQSVELAPSEEIRYYYNWPHSYFWEKFHEVPPETVLTNGVLVSSFNVQKQITDFPYPIVGIYVVVKGGCKDGENFNFKIKLHDDKKQLNIFCFDGVYDLSFVLPKGIGALPTYDYQLLLADISLKPHVLITQFQLSKKSLPSFVGGKNSIQSLDDLLGHSLLFSFGY